MSHKVDQSLIDDLRRLPLFARVHEHDVEKIASLGEPGFEAVTSSLHINFLTRPAANDMIAHAKLIRLGRRTAVAEVELFSEGVPEMVAHATATYALPRP